MMMMIKKSKLNRVSMQCMSLCLFYMKRCGERISTKGKNEEIRFVWRGNMNSLNRTTVYSYLYVYIMAMCLCLFANPLFKKHHHKNYANFYHYKKTLPSVQLVDLLCKQIGTAIILYSIFTFSAKAS